MENEVMGGFISVEMAAQKLPCLRPQKLQNPETRHNFILVDFLRNYCQFQKTQTWKIPTTFMFLFIKWIIKTELFEQLCGNLSFEICKRKKGSGKTADVNGSGWQ